MLDNLFRGTYQELAPSADARLIAYRRLFEDALSAETLQKLRECTNGKFVLGSTGSRAKSP